MNRFAYCALALFFACSPVKGTPLIDAPVAVIQAMHVEPAAIAARVGLDAPVPLSVMATLADGSTRDITPYVTWSSSDPQVATVPLGNVTAVGAGSATIAATYGDVTATASVSTRDPIIAVGNQPNGSNAVGIDFYDAFASGDTAPLRSIRGSNTQLFDAVFGMFADGSNNELYVADEASILVYPLDGSGDIAPLRQFPAGSASTLGAMLAVTLYNGELFVVGEPASGSIGEIAVFDPQSNGSGTTPKRVIAGSADNSVTQLSDLVSAVTVHDDLVYAGNTDESSVSGSITAYPVTAGGEVAPSLVFSGSDSPILEPFSIQFSGTELYVADVGHNAVEVYPIAGGSDLTPTRLLTGTDSQIQVPTAVALIGPTLVCAENAGSAVTTYPIESLEDQPPTAVLAGSNTLLHSPIGMIAF